MTDVIPVLVLMLVSIVVGIEIARPRKSTPIDKNTLHESLINLQHRQTIEVQTTQEVRVGKMTHVGTDYIVIITEDDIHHYVPINQVIEVNIQY